MTTVEENVLDKLMNAIEKNNEDEFSEALENVNSVLEAYNSLSEKAKMYEEKIEELNKLQTLAEKMLKKNEELKEKLKETKIDEQPGKENTSELMDEINYLKTTVDDLLKEIETLRSRKVYTNEDILKYTDEINNLTEKINLLNQSRPQLPIISRDVELNLSQMVVIKEIKSAIYMNSFLSFVNNYYSVLKKQHPDKNNYIIVFDRLDNECRNIKYKNRGFKLNELTNQMLITNKDWEFIKTQIDFDNVNDILFIDRTGELKIAVDYEDKDLYYMIDTPNDIIEFNLNSKQCISFYAKTEAVEYTVDPNPNASSDTVEDRESRFLDNKFVKTVICYEEI